MTAITFDTLAYAKRLKAVGFSEPQAEAMSDAFKEAQQASSSELATKADLQLVETRLEAKIDKVKTELSAQMKIYFLILLFVNILTNPKSLELIARILGIIK